MNEIELTIEFFDEFHTNLEFDFDEDRNDYFISRALKDQTINNSRVYVAITRGGQLAGFFTLCMKSVHCEIFEEKYSHPVTLLGQLAVNKTLQKKSSNSWVL